MSGNRLRNQHALYWIGGLHIEHAGAIRTDSISVAVAWERPAEDVHHRRLQSSWSAPVSENVLRREQRMLSDHQWEDIIPLTPPAHDV